MKKSNSLRLTIRALASLAATLGAVALLLADSAPPECKEGTFDQKYDISTTCGGEHQGSIRVVYPDEDTVPAEQTGDLGVTSVYVYGSCAEDDDPAEYDSLSINFGSGSCSVSLPGDLGKDVPCSTTPACTIRVSEAP